MTAVHPVVETARQEREIRGLTLVEVARRAGISRSTIGYWENGDHDPYLSVLSGYLASLGLQLAVVPASEPARPLTRMSVDQRDELLIEMRPAAESFVVRLRDRDEGAVAALLERFLHPLDLPRLLALLVAVGAMVPRDPSFDDLLSWTFASGPAPVRPAAATGTAPTNRLVRHLQRLREKAGLSRYEATRRAGLGEGSILKWETGRYGPTVHGLQQYARLFGLRVELVAEAADHQVGEAA